MGQKSINDIYTVFHALSHGIGGKYSFFQEDGELTRYHHRYIGLCTYVPMFTCEAYMHSALFSNTVHSFV